LQLVFQLNISKDYLNEGLYFKILSSVHHGDGSLLRGSQGRKSNTIRYGII